MCQAVAPPQGELATTRRLGELHREAAEGRQKKVAELEGIVQEFRQHIKVCYHAGLPRDPGACHIRRWPCAQQLTTEGFLELKVASRGSEDLPGKPSAADDLGKWRSLDGLVCLMPTCSMARSASVCHTCPLVHAGN